MATTELNSPMRSCSCAHIENESHNSFLTTLSSRILDFSPVVQHDLINVKNEWNNPDYYVCSRTYPDDLYPEQDIVSTGSNTTISYRLRSRSQHSIYGKEMQYLNGYLQRTRQVWNDSTEGFVQQYYPETTQVRSEHLYFQNKMHGWSRAWYPNGALQISCSYKYGKLSGKYQSWHRNGQKQNLSRYTNGKNDGLSQSWNSDGQLIYKQHFKDDVLHGAYQEWHPNGQLRRECTYVNGQLHGPYTSFYSTGQVTSEYHYLNGQRHGLFRYWTPEGQLQLYDYYINNQLHIRRDPQTHEVIETEPLPRIQQEEGFSLSACTQDRHFVSMPRLVQCSICFEESIDKYAVTPCKHTCCQACLMSICTSVQFRRQQGQHRCVDCWMCRTRVKLSQIYLCRSWDDSTFEPLSDNVSDNIIQLLSQ